MYNIHFRVSTPSSANMFTLYVFHLTRSRSRYCLLTVHYAIIVGGIELFFGGFFVLITFGRGGGFFRGFIIRSSHLLLGRVFAIRSFRIVSEPRSPPRNVNLLRYYSGFREFFIAPFRKYPRCDTNCIKLSAADSTCWTERAGGAGRRSCIFRSFRTKQQFESCKACRLPTSSHLTRLLFYSDLHINNYARICILNWIIS